MNQRELVEIHSRLEQADWGMEAAQSNDQWFYSFTKEIGGNNFKVSLVKYEDLYKILTTKNSTEDASFEKSYKNYDQSVYAMEDICEQIDKEI